MKKIDFHLKIILDTLLTLYKHAEQSKHILDWLFEYIIDFDVSDQYDIVKENQELLIFKIPLASNANDMMLDNLKSLCSAIKSCQLLNPGIGEAAEMEKTKDCKCKCHE